MKIIKINRFDVRHFLHVCGVDDERVTALMESRFVAIEHAIATCFESTNSSLGTY